MTEALKPCPFCGGELEQPYLRNPDVYRHPESEDCFARKAIIHPEFYSAWNTRAALDPDAVAAMVQEAVRAEREACAKVIDKEATDTDNLMEETALGRLIAFQISSLLREVAAAIRARGEA